MQVAATQTPAGSPAAQETDELHGRRAANALIFFAGQTPGQQRPDGLAIPPLDAKPRGPAAPPA
eukprot:6231376-Lingulodinium_polyedra.AAC.1